MHRKRSNQNTPFLRAPFLRAQWRDLVMLNFRADPELLKPLVPQGTELDDYEGETYVSVVGFQFLDAKVLGLRIPGHQLFEEVNLRFYVRREAIDGLRRGVVFVKEIAPKPAVAHVANLVYHENYMVCPMRSEIKKTAAPQSLQRTHYQNGKPCHGNGTSNGRVVEHPPAERTETESAEYSWRRQNRWNRVGGRRNEPFREPMKGSLDQFIVEHYWGYGRDGQGRTLEYRVNHSPWRIAPLESVRWDCDILANYGADWVNTLGQAPASGLLADGSAISVMRAARLSPQTEITAPSPVLT